jgi:hypothetical protein
MALALAAHPSNKSILKRRNWQSAPMDAPDHAVQFSNTQVQAKKNNTQNNFGAA